MSASASGAPSLARRHRRLRADRRASGRQALGRRRARRLLRRRRARPRALAARVRRRVVRVLDDAARARARRRRSSRRRTTSSPSTRARRSRPARTCWSRSRPGSASRTSTRIAEAAERARPARQGRLQPPLPSRRSRAPSRRPARAARARSCTCAPATATAAASATSASGAPSRRVSGGGELIDQGMHLLDLSYWLLGPLPLHSRAAAHRVLGHRRSRTTPSLILGERDAGPVGAVPRRAGPSGRTCSRSRSTAATAKLQVDGLVRSYGRSG